MVLKMNDFAPRLAVRFGGVGFAFVTALTVAVGGVSVPAHANDGLSGRWSGGGSVVLPSGDTEKARCRATIRKVGGRAFAMDAVCATSSVKIQQSATLQATSANRFSGEFVNSEYNVSGTINLTLSGNTLSAALRGGGGSAFFTLAR